MDRECINRIAIFRALQLGDLMCSIPAIRALRAEFPRAEIFLIGLPNSGGFVQRFPHLFNGLIKFPGFPGLPEQEYNIKEIAHFISEMQSNKFDLILQMQGNGNIVNPLVELMGARYMGGFYRQKDYKPASEFFIPYPEGHEIERHLALMKHMGISAKGTYLEYPLTDKDHEDLKNAGLLFEKGNYVCIHPGSRGSWRQWPIEYFAKLADYCAENGKKIIITGTADEIELAKQTAQLMKHNALIGAGKTTLGSIGVLLKNAFALISNCTGVSHIASALNTPGVIISMDGEPERWGPINSDILYTIDWTKDANFSLVYSKLTELFRLQNRIVKSL